MHTVHGEEQNDEPGLFIVISASEGRVRIKTNKRIRQGENMYRKARLGFQPLELQGTVAQKICDGPWRWSGLQTRASGGCTDHITAIRFCSVEGDLVINISYGHHFLSS